MQYEKPNPGETIFCWRQGQNFIGNKHILFLGEDSKKEEKILVPHPDEGWAIINLSELPLGFFRSIGITNIESSKADKNSLSEITYVFFDENNSVNLTAKYVNGTWELIKDFQMPSWVGGKDARGTGSKEDC
jgi:hypothetical protein